MQKLHILHTESSSGWGGQEIRILNEAMGIRSLGHEVILAVVPGGGLVRRAREVGLTVYEIPFYKGSICKAVLQLTRIIKKHTIDLVNTHSSLDAWMGGLSARIMGKKVIRTRHLSTPIRKGLNSILLYKKLADFVVTTCSGILPMIQSQAGISMSRLRCIPTGINPEQIQADPKEIQRFRNSLGLKQGDILIGTACFVRSWKGIIDLLKAASLLKHHHHLKWVIVGGGYFKDYQPKIQEMGLEGVVTFTGHLESPYYAIAAMDIFVLLSTSHEGISQASLQAAYLQRPLITTSIGGLPEVCLQGKTGLIVPPFSPRKVADAVLLLSENALVRQDYGASAKILVEEKFTLKHTLDEMVCVYQQLKEGS